MPRLIITEGALPGLDRCREFLRVRSSEVAQRAARTIDRHLFHLEATPGIGRPLPDMPELRELVIPFGDSGYVALYRHELVEDTVYVLAFRHQKEAGY